MPTSHHDPECYKTRNMKKTSLWFALAGLGVAIFAACSADPPIVSVSDSYTLYDSFRNPHEGIHDRKPGSSDWNHAGATASLGGRPAIPGRNGNRSSLPRRSASSLLREIKIEHDYLPYRARGRSRRSMRPRYITIHSTQNWSRGADARRHSLALKRGALGRISWHYTTDENRAVQHLPTTEQGNHAENYRGPGNLYSIGIEMCEHPGNSRAKTLERTAKLAAWLMVKHDLPLSSIKPHWNWPRTGKNPPNKNCPHFLLTNGRPGAKWRGFVKVVDRYHRQITGR